MRLSNFVRAHIALVVAAVIYSGYNILSAQAFSTGGASPVGFSVIRELGSLPVLYTWAAIAEAPLRLPQSRADLLRFTGLGFILGSFQLCFAVGTAFTDASTAALFQCVEPTTAAILGALTGAEPFTLGRGVAALLAGGGVAIIESASDHDEDDAEASGDGVERLIGCFLLFCQGLGIAAYCLLQKSLVRKRSPGYVDDDEEGSVKPLVDDDDGAPSEALAVAVRTEDDSRLGGEGATTAYGPITVTAHAYGSSLVLLLIAAGIDTLFGIEADAPFSPDSLARLGSPCAVAAVVYAILLASVIGYSLRAMANRHVDASVLVLYNATQPPITALLALALASIFPAPKYGWQQVVGTVLVVGAVFVSVQDKQLARWLRKFSWPCIQRKRAGCKNESESDDEDLILS